MASPRKCLFLVLAVAAVLRVFCFVGPRYNDEFEYSYRAHLLGAGRLDLTQDVYSQRLGVVVPTFLFQKLLGVGAVSSACLSELASLGLVGITFLFGLRTHSLATAVVGALLVAIYPLDLLASSQCYTDLPAAFLSATALYSYLRAGEEGSHRWIVLAALCLGGAHLMKESAFFMLFVLVAWTWLFKVPWVRFGSVAALFAGIVLAECLMYGLVTGDFFQRFHTVTAGKHGQDIASIYGSPGEVAHRLFFTLPLMLFHPLDYQFPFFGLYGYALVAAVLGLAWSRKISLARGCIAWGLVMALLMNFWPLSLRPYRPSFMLVARTLEALTVPAAVVIAVAAVEFWRAGRGRLGLKIAGMVMVLSSLGLAALMKSYFIEWRDSSRGAYLWLREQNAAKVYADQLSLWYFNLWQGYGDEMKGVNLHLRPDLPKDGYVILNDHYLTFLRDRERTAPPPWVMDLSGRKPSYQEQREDTLRRWRQRLIGRPAKDAAYRVRVFEFR